MSSRILNKNMKVRWNFLLWTCEVSWWDSEKSNSRRFSFRVKCGWWEFHFLFSQTLLFCTVISFMFFHIMFETINRRWYNLASADGQIVCVCSVCVSVCVSDLSSLHPPPAVTSVIWRTALCIQTNSSVKTPPLLLAFDVCVCVFAARRRCENSRSYLLVHNCSDSSWLLIPGDYCGCWRQSAACRAPGADVTVERTAKKKLKIDHF